MALGFTTACRRPVQAGLTDFEGRKFYAQLSYQLSVRVEIEYFWLFAASQCGNQGERQGTWKADLTQER